MVHRLQVAVVRSDSAPKCLFSSIHRYHPTSHYLSTSSFQFDRSVSPSANHQPTQTPLINRRSTSLVFASLHTSMHTYLFRLCIRFSFPVHTTPCLSILSITSPTSLSTCSIKLTRPPQHTVHIPHRSHPDFRIILQISFVLSLFLPIMYVGAE